MSLSWHNVARVSQHRYSRDVTRYDGKNMKKHGKWILVFAIFRCSTTWTRRSNRILLELRKGWKDLNTCGNNVSLKTAWYRSIKSDQVYDVSCHAVQKRHSQAVFRTRCWDEILSLIMGVWMSSAILRVLGLFGSVSVGKKSNLVCL